MDLAVDEPDVPRRELADACGERDLRRIGRVREHRLAEERGAERHAVEAADQLVAPPGLDRVREAELVELAVRGDHLRDQPRAALAGPRHRRAALEHPQERRVHAQLVGPLADRLAQALLDDQIVDGHHHPRIRRVPQDRQVLGVPGEDARAVAEQ